VFSAVLIAFIVYLYFILRYLHTVYKVDACRTDGVYLYVCLFACFKLRTTGWALMKSGIDAFHWRPPQPLDFHSAIIGNNLVDARTCGAGATVAPLNVES
jgi:hypothetical protein